MCALRKDHSELKNGFFDFTVLGERRGDAAPAPPPAVCPAPSRARRDTAKTVKDHRAGHRDRLRDRFNAVGVAGVADYELLELILYRALPRRDVKPLAKTLLDRFGSFSEVINAPPDLLKETHLVGDCVVTELKVVRAAALQLKKDKAVERPLLSSWTAVLDYCHAAMGYENREQFRVLFLDKRNRIIADEVQQIGTVDHTPVYKREVVKRALELSATAMILLHNHPSGDPEPSRADITMTRQLVETAGSLGIVIHDHIVIGREGHVSFKERRLL